MKKDFYVGLFAMAVGLLTYWHFNQLWFDNLWDLKQVAFSHFRDIMFLEKYVWAGILSGFIAGYGCRLDITQISIRFIMGPGFLSIILLNRMEWSSIPALFYSVAITFIISLGLRWFITREESSKQPTYYH